MTRKLIDISIISVGIIFLCWYLPVAINNVYACDDYWFGTNVRINGFWGNQLFYWYNWEGSYTHTFLASLPHAFHSSYMPFFSNMFSFLLIYTSIYIFFRTYSNITIKRGCIYSLYLLSFLFLCTNGNSEIRFWVCANITYVSEMSFLLCFFSLYHIIDKDFTFLKWILLILLLFLIGGCKLTFILYAISGLVIHDVIYEKSVSKITFIVFLILAVFLFLNIGAPGNYIRWKEETMPKDYGDQMTFVEAIIYRFIEMKSYLLSTIFLLPVATQWNTDVKLKEKRILVVLIICIVTFILDSVIMYICFKDSGPLRVYFIAEVFTAVLVLFLLNKLYTSVICRYKYEKVVILFFSIWVAISNIPMLLQIRDSIEFSVKARERDQYVFSCREGEVIEITPLPKSHLILSYFANDEIWLERIYLPYFQKTNKFILLKPQKSDE